jgi:excinuclease ABC subunit A
MAASDIVIRGAREHNLRDVHLVIPRNKLVCLTGVSGSGKSSLAFDTLFAEGQRRYVESLSTFARQFLGQMPKPDVDLIDGLSPSISISQKTSGQNPRSTVGTITEIYDYLRVLYARTGQGHCPQCGRPITAQTREQIIEQMMALPQGTRFALLAPIVRSQKGEFRDLFDDLQKRGFVRARVDGRIVMLSDNLRLDRQMRHNIELVVDRLVAGPAVRARLSESVELALQVGEGNLIVAADEPSDAKSSRRESPAPVAPTGGDSSAACPPQSPRLADLHLSLQYACTSCKLSFEPPSPQLFSFNSPQGMCLTCDGLGESFAFDQDKLIPDPAKSFQQGCFELIGKWRDLGRWKRHIYEGVAETLEYKYQLPAGTILETPWEALDPQFQKLLLWGTGGMHITFSWKHSGGVYKYGGVFEGIIPELLSKYKNSKSGMQRRQLEQYMRVVHCGDCNGQRLNSRARSVKLASRHPRFAGQAKSLPEVCALAVAEAAEFFSELELDGLRQRVAAEVLKEIRGRLGFLQGVGLGYLSLDRRAPSLSGGESQRIRLAGQVGCGLVGVLYILDEPSIGLHPRDNQRLLDTLLRLRDLGNTVVVVEHDEETMRAADHMIDFGPGPGVRGGQVVASGSAEDVEKSPRSLTGKYLSGQEKIEIPPRRRIPNDQWLRIEGAAHNNLQDITVEIPLGLLVCVTGVSGSGKSSLVNDILAEALWRDLNGGEGHPGQYRRITGLEHLDKLIAIDQSPIGRTPRSNPGTYIKVFDEIRRLYAQLPDSKARGYKEGRFSFNVPGGRCEACEGNGSNRLEMDFLADVWVTCPVCEGHRFTRETLQIRYKGKSIAEVLEMDVQQALEHFQNIPRIRNALQTLHDVGLDYIKLGQPSPTLSGGEAQRIKLARELVKRSTGKTLYLLDEPTTGLHFADIKLLLKVLNNFVEAGNTVLVVEHNLDVIKTADWIIDLGPEGGADGGRIVAAGPPDEIVRHPQSHTGAALAPILQGGGHVSHVRARRLAQGNGAPAITEIRVRGARQHNLKNLDVDVPRDRLTVFCGPSGSGKSSLAMDTIYAEGQRRYVESLSSYARQFVSQMQKPQLEHIEGLSPAIAIEQKNLGHTPRSTVGTVTEIYDYFRVLMARLGKPYCPACDIPIGTQTVDEIVAKLLNLEPGNRIYVMAPQEVEVGEAYEALWDELRSSGFQRVRIDSHTHTLDDLPKIDRRRKHRVEVVVDRLTIRPEHRARITDSVETALTLGKGVCHVALVRDDLPEPRWPVTIHSQHLACERCGRSFEPLSPHHFSFNSSLGWCPVCQGLGTQTGTNPAALIPDPKLSLADGAVSLWPDPSAPLSRAMLEALGAHAQIPLEVPFADLTPRQKRVIFHGTGEEWIEARLAAGRGSAPGREALGLVIRFQYKGLYPALDEASRLSPSFRARLEHLVDEVECGACGGSRLRDDAAAVRFRGQTIRQIVSTPLKELLRQVKRWKLDRGEQKIAGELFREIRNRLSFLVEVGLEYLTLARPAPTLSGGESQRIRLASQVGSGLTGVLYVLDEPTIGLHPRDNQRLIKALLRLRDLGNTLLLVEHDREVIRSADRLLDFGPGAGQLGGRIVAQGAPEELVQAPSSVTGPYLSGARSIPIPANRRIAPRQDGAELSGGKDRKAAGNRTSGPARQMAMFPDGTADDGKRVARESRSKSSVRNAPATTSPKAATPTRWLEIVDARHNNLQGVNVEIPLGTLTVVTGVSGSGKSSLVEDVLYNALARTLHRASTLPGAHREIRGIQHINKVIRVDQQPLGNTPTSNPATYTGVFDHIRALYSQLPDAKVRGYSARRFSFNVPGGRCEKCEGNGQLRIEMHFLPDVWVECDICRGQRYNPDTLAVKFKGHSINDVLNLPIGKALELFENIPDIRRILTMLKDVGLDYLTLGQAAPTLSGGEAQRVKLAAELARPDTGRTLYLLDEPTTGLHFEDLARLLDVLNRLVDLGNTVVVIEHNLDVIKTADWVIDLGPEAGEQGGRVVVAGTPEEVVAHAHAALKPSRSGAGRGERKRLRSYTGEMLAAVMSAAPVEVRPVYDRAAAEQPREEDLAIEDVGQSVRMPWEVDGRRWHTVDRVGRGGEPCEWDGQILAQVVDRIHELGEFSPTNWNHRSIVEICAARKSAGWFFHAITGERWLVKLKFRVAKRTFQREELVHQLELKPLNDMPELPIYGSEPRVKCKNLRGPWQEVELHVHRFEEIDRQAFWSFLERAVQGFLELAARMEQRPQELVPWRVLGQKWHFSRRGFPPGKTVEWPPELLEELCEMLADVAPSAQFLWNNQQLVHIFVSGQRDPWATIFTKRLAYVELVLTGPKDRFGLGRVADFAADREVLTEHPDCDLVKMRFVTLDDLHRGDLRAFLREHLAGVAS